MIDLISHNFHKLSIYIAHKIGVLWGIFFCNQVAKKRVWGAADILSPWASLKSYNLSKNGYGLWKLTGAATGLGKKKLHWFWLKPGEKWKMWFKSQVKTSPTHKRAIIVYKWLQPFVLVQTSKVLTKNAKENGCKVTTIQIQTWNQVLCNCLCFSSLTLFSFDIFSLIILWITISNPAKNGLKISLQKV